MREVGMTTSGSASRGTRDTPLVAVHLLAVRNRTEVRRNNRYKRYDAPALREPQCGFRSSGAWETRFPS